VKYVELTVQGTALVDDEDYEVVVGYRWHLLNGYAVTWVDDKLMYMHWLVLGLYIWGFLVVTSNVSGDRLDNRKSNLAAEQPPDKSLKSGVKGIYWIKAKEKWEAELYIAGRQIYLGQYAEKKDAIEALRLARIERSILAKSKHKGVYYSSKKHRWRAQIYIGGKQRSVGTFDTEEEAAKAYKEAATA